MKKNSTNDVPFSTIISEISQRKKDSKESKSLFEIFYLVRLSLDYSRKKYNIIPTNLSYMFYGCSSLISISGISKWNTNYVKNISHMFEECSSLISIDDISQWKLKKIIDISIFFLIAHL